MSRIGWVSYTSLTMLPIQQYMGDSALPDQMSEMELSNEFVIEPAMRSVSKDRWI